MVGTRVVALTKSCIVVFRARPAASGQEDRGGQEEGEQGGEAEEDIQTKAMYVERLAVHWRSQPGPTVA